MCQRKDQVRKLGHVQVSLGPLSALRILIACLAVLLMCHRGASWVSTGYAARHQHLSGSPGTPLATGRPSINTTSCPDMPPGLPPVHIFLCSVAGNYANLRRTENREDGESPLKTVLCAFGDIFTGHDLCWHRHCLLIFRDSSELLCIMFLIVIIYFFLG